VRQCLELGSHTLFLAAVEAVQVCAALIDRTGRLRLDRAGLLAFAHGEYFSLGRTIGRFGFSVRRKKTRTPRPAAGKGAA
jgi:flavin reductase (DIM6/NTAB) family NADH-FMN oxidoreductase RutF